MKSFLILAFVSIYLPLHALDHYYKTPVVNGQAPLAIFIHGAMGDHHFISEDDLTDWQHTGFAVLSISIPGHGGSEGNSDTFGPRDRKAVVDFLRIFKKEHLNQISWDEVVIYGFSFGGLVAVEIHQDLFPHAKLILESSPLSIQQEMAETNPYEKYSFNWLEFSAFKSFKSVLLGALIDGDNSTEKLYDRSLIGRWKNSEADVLYFFGTEDFRYSQSLLDTQTKEIQKDNPEAHFDFVYFEGEHELTTRSPLRNTEIFNFIKQ